MTLKNDMRKAARAPFIQRHAVARTEVFNTVISHTMTGIERNTRYEDLL